MGHKLFQQGFGSGADELVGIEGEGEHVSPSGQMLPVATVGYFQPLDSEHDAYGKARCPGDVIKPHFAALEEVVAYSEVKARRDDDLGGNDKMARQLVGKAQLIVLYIAKEVGGLAFGGVVVGQVEQAMEVLRGEGEPERHLVGFEARAEQYVGGQSAAVGGRIPLQNPADVANGQAHFQVGFGVEECAAQIPEQCGRAVAFKAGLGEAQGSSDGERPYLVRFAERKGDIAGAKAAQALPAGVISLHLAIAHALESEAPTPGFAQLAGVAEAGVAGAGIVGHEAEAKLLGHRILEQGGVGQKHGWVSVGGGNVDAAQPCCTRGGGQLQKIKRKKAANLRLDSAWP